MAPAFSAAVFGGLIARRVAAKRRADRRWLERRFVGLFRPWGVAWTSGLWTAGLNLLKSGSCRARAFYEPLPIAASEDIGILTALSANAAAEKANKAPEHKLSHLSATQPPQKPRAQGTAAHQSIKKMPSKKRAPPSRSPRRPSPKPKEGPRTRPSASKIKAKARRPSSMFLGRALWPETKRRPNERKAN